MSKNKEKPLIEAPENTVRKEEMQQSEIESNVDFAWEDELDICIDDEVIVCDDEIKLITDEDLEENMNAVTGGPKNATSQLRQMTGKEQTR